ncbi:MAG TPA: hypothetical protein VF590_02715 [Isosphaeraceae bacterium]|jgi:hypothetical protein
MSTSIPRPGRWGFAIAQLGPCILLTCASAQDAAPSPAARIERVETADGRRLTGRLVADATGGFRFALDEGGAEVALEAARRVTFEGSDPDPKAGDPPFHVDLGLGQRISGRLGAVTDRAIRLDDGPGGEPVTVARSGALGLLQRPGEVQVLRDGFEAIDPGRWAATGAPDVVADPHREAGHGLRLPARGAALKAVLPEPVDSGRLDLFFSDGGARVPGRRWLVELWFRRPTGDEPIQVVLGWEDESPEVISRGGPALTVQLLVRQPGRHRLTVQFGPERTLMAIDGAELAHGKGPEGALSGIRLAAETSGRSDGAEDLAAFVDDLRLVRRVEPTGSLESDPTQDEVRLPRGDQVFGSLRKADAESVALDVDDREVVLNWSEVAGLYFRRSPEPGAPVAGLLARLEWQPGPGRDTDAAEGALVAVSEESLSLATPYAGTLTVPRDRLRLLQVLGRGRRVVLDPFPHHLGDQVMPEYHPPQPEGGVLELSFPLDAVPDGSAVLAFDVVGVEGEVGLLRFAQELRRGELRTNVRLNGQVIDHLNRQIASKNEVPERIRLPIPAGLLRAGRNVVRIEQVGRAQDPEYLDDLGVLGIALEAETEAPRRPGQP